MSDTDDDQRSALAEILVPGEDIVLALAAGRLVDAQILHVDGVDLELAIDGLPPLEGSLVTARAHDGVHAWFATLVVGGHELLDDGRVVTHLRVGDALRVSSERWSERAGHAEPAVLRPESEHDVVLRGRTCDISRTGVAIVVHDGDLPVGARAGIVLGGAGAGTVAFRGLVRRRGWAEGGRLLGVEVIGISTEDDGRLARLVALSERATTEG